MRFEIHLLRLDHKVKYFTTQITTYSLKKIKNSLLYLTKRDQGKIEIDRQVQIFK
jgi:hypothetical protein